MKILDLVLKHQMTFELESIKVGIGNPQWGRLTMKFL